LPDEVCEQILSLHRTDTTIAMAQLAEYLAIHRLLSSAGIVDMPLKGPALGQALFGHVAARRSADIDVWVAPSDHARADAALRESGYVRRRPAQGFRPKQLTAYKIGNNEFTYFGPRGHTLDLHWRLHPLDRLAPLEFHRVILAGHTIRLGGTDVPWFSDEDLYVYLLTHGSRERWYQLKWVVDALTLYRRNPGKLAAYATAAGVSRIHQQLMLLCTHLFRMDNLISPFSIEKASWRLRDDALRSMRTVEQEPGLLWWTGYFLGRPLYYARLRDDAQYRREVWRTEYFTPHYGEIQALPDWALPFFWLLRPFVFLARYGRA
jgi:hypothetical protein